VCHQTVGLIARQLEASGIPTVTMTSALDITEAVAPPRSVFLDFPLGHTSGRAHDPALGLEIVSRALAAFSDADSPGWIGRQHLRWSADDSWKESVMRPAGATAAASVGGANSAGDDRSPRLATPQYQSPADKEASAACHEGSDCVVCKGVDY